MVLSQSVMMVKMRFLVPFDCCILMMLRMIFSAFCMCTFSNWIASPFVFTFFNILVFTICCKVVAQ